MRAVMSGGNLPEKNASSALKTIQVETNPPAFGQVVVDVRAAGVNRADVLQASGNYPPPPGASHVLGLEFAGVVSAVGDGVTAFEVGQEVTGLTDSGAYAEQITIPDQLLLPIPASIDIVTAGSIMEAACTAWSNLYDVAHLNRGEVVLIHGGSGGVGSFAIQLAAARGAKVIATARNKERAQRCLELGASHCFTYQTDNGESLAVQLPELISQSTNGHGADVIFDVLGAEYLDTHLDSLADGGRLVVIGLQRGAKAPLNLGKLMSRRASISGTTLRSRSLEQKAQIVRSVYEHVWPLIESGQITPIVHAMYPLEQAAQAHQALNSGEVFGKLLLTP